MKKFLSLKKRFGKKKMKSLWDDESGVILSAEIVLVGTILVLGMITGLVELQSAVVYELTDLSEAFGKVDQTFSTSGFKSLKEGASCGDKARTKGALYNDVQDDCDAKKLEIVCGDAGEASP